MVATARSLKSRAILLLALVALLALMPAVAAAESPPAFLFKFGTFGSGNLQFDSPFGVAVAGSIYVADTNNKRIQKFTPAGIFETQWIAGDSLGGCAGGLCPVVAVVTDGTNVYTAGPDSAKKWSTTGTLLATYGNGVCGNLTAAHSLALSGNTLYAGTHGSCGGTVRIVKIDIILGSVTAFVTAIGSGDGQIGTGANVALATDSSGNVYVSDTGNNRVQKFNSSGTFLAKWGTPGSGNGEFSLNVAGHPGGIAVDASGNVYVADTGNNRIQKFTSTGNFLTKWGSAGSGDGLFTTPRGIAVDGSGKVYVADTGNNRIQVFGAAAPPSCTPPPSGMVSWWPGDGNATDIQGANHGTLQNGATFAPGLVGQAFDFDGVNDFVQVPNAALNNLPAGTIDMWIFPTAPGGSSDFFGRTWFAKQHDNINSYAVFAFASQTSRVLFHLSNQAPNVVGTTPLTLNTWHHVAATWDGSFIRLYVDSVEDGKVASSASLPSDLGSVTSIGAWTGHGNRFFEGRIDEVETFNRALSALEIDAIFHAGSAGKCKALPPQPNQPPTANAGPDQTVNENTAVTLNGTGSSDPDNNPLSFAWVQMGGPAVLVTGANTVTPTFTSPQVPAELVSLTLSFDLTVNDGFGGTSTDTVVITVNDVLPAQVQAARTIGYWKNHQTHVQQMLTQDGPINLGDTVITTVAQAVGVLSNASARDARDALRAQLLGTILNLRNGSNPFATPPDIRPTVTSAKAFLASHPSAVNGGHPDRATAIALKDRLDAYNNSGE
jgi:hypothetical protein